MNDLCVLEKMVVEQLKEQLIAVKTQIQNWQSDETDSTAEVRFEALEQELRELLNQITLLPPAERAQIDPIITQFRSEMEEQYAVTKEKLDETRRQFEISQTRANAVKAYNKQTL